MKCADEALTCNSLHKKSILNSQYFIMKGNNHLLGAVMKHFANIYRDKFASKNILLYSQLATVAS